MITFAMKAKLARLVRARTDLSPMARLIFCALIDCLNVEKGDRNGQCNPTDAMLAAMCGTSERTVSRWCHELKEKGVIAKKLTRGAPSYTFDWSLIEADGSPDMADQVQDGS